jgi:hypothetical protein
MNKYYFVENVINPRVCADGLGPVAFGILAQLEAQRATIEILFTDIEGPTMAESYYTIRVPDGRLLYSVSGIYFCALR